MLFRSAAGLGGPIYRPDPSSFPSPESLPIHPRIPLAQAAFVDFEDRIRMQIKGSSIRSKLQFLAETFGTEAEQALSNHLQELDVRTVLEANWYPYELYDRVLRWIADHHYGGQLRRLREVGRFSAHHALTGTYAVYLERGDFRSFLRRIATLHGRYYDIGSLKTTLIGDDHAELVLIGAPFYREPDLEVAAGFYTGAAELMGLSQVSCSFEMGSDRVEFRLDWRSEPS